ncbi:ribosome maturation factor RimM [Acetobacter syzygii]|uniref:Ribosome maturation factor RimM n=1 Tax=Acetobacter syzygii TaxID=146476 RepID=A0A270BMH8_9PROT|nr:ribosome maturation factor RimM [Acetobacter syzygii]NSL93298.1 16S rRNA processing protein RimM [Acetobacter syzygii]PAL26212.1 16S rRNA processing protein RimM [Acetobacter syzygii]PAL26368.1 16S rRNA processing protein RimM [Acetobacter syzygii]GAN70082.1 ribosomal RNA 16S processing protein RimM [Acetobacter syzygii]GBR62029.1 ribosomal RNA small subunit 16S rRNA processing protein RimM [Acetobacter syzygii NRIC 0483]
MQPDLILIGVVGKPHGVRGLVRVHSYAADPAMLEEYGVLLDGQGRKWSLRWCGADGVAEIKDANGKPLADRTAAQALVNTRLFVPRSCLPETEEEEFYHADLIGMEAFEKGLSLGRVIMVHDYGAGASLELGDGSLVPFTKACVPEVKLDERTIVVVRPEEVSGEEGRGVGKRQAGALA